MVRRSGHERRTRSTTESQLGRNPDVKHHDTHRAWRQVQGARGAGNHRREDLPLDDSTDLAIDLGEGAWLNVSLGTWRELVARVEADIAAIPAERQAWHAREAERSERRARYAAQEPGDLAVQA